MASNLSSQVRHRGNLPMNHDQWVGHAERAGVLNTSIHELAIADSVSKISEKEFLALRVIFPPRRQIYHLQWPQQNKKLCDTAQQLISSDAFPELRVYTEQLRDRGQAHLDPSARGLGPLLHLVVAMEEISDQHPPNTTDSNSVVIRRNIPRQAQLVFPPASLASMHSNMVSSPSVTMSGNTALTAAAEGAVPWVTKTDDEEFVKRALVNFLSAFTLNIPGTPCRWIPGSWPLNKAQFKNVSFTSRVDGYLMAPGHGVPDIFSITQVKASLKDGAIRPSVYWQEAAGMVTWIKHDLNPDNKRCRKLSCGYLLISQHNHEVYITRAIPSEGYLDYLRGDFEPPVLDNRRQDPAQDPAGRNDCYLTMQEYGPWNTTNPSHVKSLALVITALTLEATQLVAEAKAKESPDSEHDAL